MTSPQNWLNDLNPQQRQAVTAGTGQILVLAGPGSGKTRVLTQRIAYLVGGPGVRPYNILAVTFTNKAAREMETRLRHLLDEASADLWLGTFHAICARILRREADFLPFKSNFVIMDADDQQALVKRSLKELKLDEKLYRPPSIHAAISTAKNHLVDAPEMTVRSYRDEVVRRVYEQYQKLLRNNNAVDFDDLLMVAVRLFEENPAVREKYARRFEHVLVDEFQDTNLAQYKLLQQLSSYHHNIFVVGDEDQSIYRWRGADYMNVLRFEEEHREAQKILLEQNYRSTQTVLDAARAVIDRNPNRTHKRLFSDRGRGERIVLFEAADDHAESAYVVDTISKMINKGNAKGADFAVMYRTNAQSRLLEEAFLRAGLPYRLVGAQRFYGRREVKDLIAFLRLVQNPADEISLQRVINVPPRGIGDKTLVALQLKARQVGTSPGAIVLDLGLRADESSFWNTFTGRGAAVLADFGAMLNGWGKNLDETPLPALFDRILTELGYQAYIQDGTEEGEDRWGNVQELRRLAYEYKERGLVVFLENLALVSDQDTLPEKPDAPTLLTLHAAKGLEFGRVFIVGLDEGLLPHSRSFDDVEEMAEERRLFYVGVTRAKDHLYLVRAERRSTYGQFEVNEASRFLEDLPDELVQHEGAVRPWKAGKTSGESWYGQKQQPRLERWQSNLRQGAGAGKAESSANMVQPRYRPAMRVRHAKWGEGMVVGSKVVDGEEEVDVMFSGVGLKRLLASLAVLEILNG